MGVLTLWPLLEAARETCDLRELSGKTLAVDLSGWICEACALRATLGKINKPHIRTLFFRVAQLYRLDVKLVFVCDGSAVELKYDTIAKRIDARNGRSTSTASAAKAGSAKNKKKASRTQLNRRVKEVSRSHLQSHIFMTITRISKQEIYYSINTGQKDMGLPQTNHVNSSWKFEMILYDFHTHRDGRLTGQGNTNDTSDECGTLPKYPRKKLGLFLDVCARHQNFS